MSELAEKKVPAPKRAAKKVAEVPACFDMSPDAWPVEYQQGFVAILQTLSPAQLVGVHTVLAYVNGKLYKQFFRWYRDKKAQLPGGSAAPARKI